MGSRILSNLLQCENYSYILLIKVGINCLLWLNGDYNIIEEHYKEVVLQVLSTNHQIRILL